MAPAATMKPCAERRHATATVVRIASAATIHVHAGNASIRSNTPAAAPMGNATAGPIAGGV